MTRIRASEATFQRPSEVAPDSVVTVFRVPPEVAGQRLDIFLVSQMRRTSRTRVQEIVRLSAYDDRGRRLSANHRVQAEQQVLLWRAPWDETPVPTDIPVIYEDEHLLAVNKPALVPVHPTARYHHNTVIKLLQAERPGEFLVLGHRIDRETSGVLLLARSPAAERALKRQLEKRDGIEKRYLAFTWGVPQGPSGEQDFRLEASLELDPDSRYKVKMRIGQTPDALFAATRFYVRGTRTGHGRTYARVECHLETGRQHQIRVHLASLGTPIVGDKLYGPDEGAFARGADDELTAEDVALLELPRHALHAMHLELPHPMTRKPLLIEAPLPSDLGEFWDNLRED